MFLFKVLEGRGDVGKVASSAFMGAFLKEYLGEGDYLGTLLKVHDTQLF